MRYSLKLVYAVICIAMGLLVLTTYSEKKHEADSQNNVIRQRIFPQMPQQENENTFDTLQYYNNLTKEVRGVRRDQFGVWFSPDKNCIKLTAIEYIFKNQGNDSIPVQGFVNKVPLYPNGGKPLRDAGQNITTFRFFIPHQDGNSPVSAIVDLDLMGRAVQVSDSEDFFIGWVMAGGDSIAFPTGYEDSDSGKYLPSRSYVREPQAFHPWLFNLGIRAIFLCQAQVPDTSGFTFVLSWSDRVADLRSLFNNS